MLKALAVTEQTSWSLQAEKTSLPIETLLESSRFFFVPLLFDFSEFPFYFFYYCIEISIGVFIEKYQSKGHFSLIVFSLFFQF